MTSTELACALGRSALWVSGIARQLSLPACPDYPGSYVAFLNKIRDLENLSVSREKIARLWEIEKSLIRLLHLVPGEDFLQIIAGCSAEADPDRRLLLSNADLGVPLLARDLQPGLDFTAEKPHELFGGREMGEDAVRLLVDYRTELRSIMAAIAAERPVLKETLRWEKSVNLRG